MNQRDAAGVLNNERLLRVLERREEILSDHRVQIQRVVIAFAVAAAVLPIRAALWNRASPRGETVIALAVAPEVQDSADRLCTWSR